MANVVPAVTQSQLSPDDDTPLLGGGPGNRSDGALPSAFTVHRKRLEALFRAAWDSGVACVCGAALVFSFAALFVKLMGSAIPVFQIVAFRSVISFVVCAAYARAAGIRPLFGHSANLRFLISRGLFGAAAMTTYYFSIKMLPLADAVTLFFLNPAITAVAAWAIMKEPLGIRGVGGVLVSLSGLVLLTRPPSLFGHRTEVQASGAGAGLHGDTSVGVGMAGASGDGISGVSGGQGDKERLLGSMFGLLSALLSAGAFISIRFIGKSEPALVVSVYFHVSAAATSIVPLAVGLPTPAVWPTGVQWALLLGVACCSFWGQILIGRSFQLLNAARASAINLTQVVYSYVLGLLFLHEQLTLLGGAGSVLIAIGAVLVNLRPKATPPASALPAAAPAIDGEGAAAATAAAEDIMRAEEGAREGTGKDAAGASAVPAAASSESVSETVSQADCGMRSHLAGVVVTGTAETLELAEFRLCGDGSNGDSEEVRRGQEPWRGVAGERGPADVVSERRPLLPSPVGLPGGKYGGAVGENGGGWDEEGLDTAAPPTCGDQSWGGSRMEHGGENGCVSKTQQQQRLQQDWRRQAHCNSACHLQQQQQWQEQHPRLQQQQKQQQEQQQPPGQPCAEVEDYAGPSEGRRAADLDGRRLLSGNIQAATSSHQAGQNGGCSDLQVVVGQSGTMAVPAVAGGHTGSSPSCSGVDVSAGLGIGWVHMGDCSTGGMEAGTGV